MRLYYHVFQLCQAFVVFIEGAAMFDDFVGDESDFHFKRIYVPANDFIDFSSCGK
jgi:hypothetical protein